MAQADIPESSVRRIAFPLTLGIALVRNAPDERPDFAVSNVDRGNYAIISGVLSSPTFETQRRNDRWSGAPEEGPEGHPAQRGS
jgi:hypothetical protein